MMLLNTRPPVLQGTRNSNSGQRHGLSGSSSSRSLRRRGDVAVAARARGPQGPSADDDDDNGGGFIDDASAARLRNVLKRRGMEGLARAGVAVEEAAAATVGAAAPSQQRGSVERGAARRRALFADGFDGDGQGDDGSFARGGRGRDRGLGGSSDEETPPGRRVSSSADGRGFGRGGRGRGRGRGRGDGDGGRGGDGDGGRGAVRARAASGTAPERAAPAAPARTAPPRPKPPPAAAPAIIPLVRQRSDGAPGKASLFFAPASWASLGASPEVVAALAAAGVTRPSHVQAAAYRALLDAAPSEPQQRKQQQQQQQPPGSAGAAAAAAAGRHVALADAAGSGKTLAYLLPLLQKLREEDAAGGRPATAPGSPRVLIVAPTAELAQQVQRVLRALVAGGLRVRTALMTGGQEDAARRARALRTQADALRRGVDVAIATPGRAVALLERGDLSLAATKAVVLDEVDILAGGPDLYKEQVEPLQAAAPQTARFVLVSATLPAHTFAALEEAFPGLTPAFGPGLHRVASGATEELVDCSGGGDVSLETGVKRKLAALSAALDRHRAARVAVFCNKIEACRAVENHLRRHHGRGASNGSGSTDGGGGGGGGSGGDPLSDPVAAGAAASSPVDVYAYHDAVSEDARAAALLKFLAPPPASDGGGGGAPPHQQQQQQRRDRQRQQREGSSPPPSLREDGDGDGNDGGRGLPVVLVCTDRTSRGLDSAHCDHVVLFDFPRDPSEYVRRAGRTARGAGGRGVVTVLVLGKQVPLAQEIIAQNAKGRPVHRVPLDAGW